MAVTNLAKLMANIEKIVVDTIQNDPHITNTVVQTGQENVKEHVYSYQPKRYQRTYGLYNEWKKENVDKGIKIYNDRRDGDKYIPEVIETGQGYDFTGYGYEYEKPRPFISESAKELKSNKKHIEALKSSLKKKGVTVG